ncbi:MAG: cyclic lactone autoinducer peptide [Clostridiales bacterium]|nr:cyclic lactone autoinducer peptide [Clostridiales bacterium]
MKKKLFLDLLKNLAALALVITVKNTCLFILYQPEVPDEARTFKIGRK